jgi:hypothetical protein
VRICIDDLEWFKRRHPGLNFGDWVRKKIVEERLSENDSTATFVSPVLTPESKEQVYERNSGGVRGVSRNVHEKPEAPSEDSGDGAKAKREVKCVEVHNATFKFVAQTRMANPPAFWMNPHHLNERAKRTTSRINGGVKHRAWLAPYGEGFEVSDIRTGAEGEVYIETTSKARKDLEAGTTFRLVVSARDDTGVDPNDLARRADDRKERAWVWLVENWVFMATPPEDSGLAKFGVKGHPMADMAAKARVVIHPPREGGLGTDSTPDGPTIHAGGKLWDAAKVADHFLRGSAINGEALKHIEERLDSLEERILERLRQLEPYVPSEKLGREGYS